LSSYSHKKVIKKPVIRRDCSKNPHRHSERSEESHIFLRKSKNQKRDISDFILRMTRKDRFIKILEHPLHRVRNLVKAGDFSQL